MTSTQPEVSLATVSTLTAITVMAVLGLQAWVVPMAERSYQPHEPSDDWAEARKLDPPLGTAYAFSFLSRLQGPSVVIAFGECTACTASKLRALSPKDWRSGRIVIVTDSARASQALISEGFSRHASILSCTSADMKHLNAYFQPRAYLVSTAGSIIAKQDDTTLLRDFVISMTRGGDAR